MDPNARQPRPFIIPIFLPHTGCPHRCVFCDQSAITGQTLPLPRPDQIRSEINKFLKFSKHPHETVQISFYGGNFLGLPEITVRRLLDLATEFIATGDVNSIRFSTRPDTIYPHRLAWLAGYRVATIELGAQSMDNRVLEKSNRGHRAADTEKAMALLKDGGYETGLQMMLGLPADTAAGALASGRRMQALAPNFVRIYPALVLSGSLLAELLAAGDYTPLTLDAAVDISAQLYKLFTNSHIRVVRMGLQSSIELNQGNTVLAGPYHPAFGQLVMSKLFLDSVCRELRRHGHTQSAISIAVSPRSVSHVKGQKKNNMAALRRMFATDNITVSASPELADTQVRVNMGAPVSILSGA